MNTKLKIALVVSETGPIPDVLGGGAERLVTMLINQNEIEDKAHFIVVSTYNKLAKKKSKKYKNTQFIYIRNINPFVKCYNLFSVLLSKITKSYIKKRGYYDVAAKKLNDKCDIVIDENGYTKEFDFFVKRYKIDQILAHIHWKVNPHEKQIDQFYGGAIGVSQFITKYWMDNSDNKITEGMVVYSAVDEKRFNNDFSEETLNNLRKKYSISKHDIVFLYCGRLHRQKGIAELVKAFNKLDAPNAKLLIVGGNILKDSKFNDFETRIHDLAKGNDRIVFTGYVNNEVLKYYYRVANVQIIPTITEEAAGLVAIEGMLSGLPIIACRSGGLPEYLDEKCSIIVEKNSDLVDNIRNAMEILYNSSNLREKMSYYAKEHAKNYTQKKFYNDFVDTIRSYYLKRL